MAALTLDTTDFEVLAQLIAREMPLIPQIPPFISEAALAERWPWTSARTLQEARLGNGKLFVKGRGFVQMPDHLAGGQKVGYYLARRSGVRSVLDVEDELASGAARGKKLVPTE